MAGVLQQLQSELEPGMKVSAGWVSRRYGVSLRTARRVLRRLWLGQVATREWSGRWLYEARQLRLL